MAGKVPNYLQQARMACSKYVIEYQDRRCFGSLDNDKVGAMAGPVATSATRLVLTRLELLSRHRSGEGAAG